MTQSPSLAPRSSRRWLLGSCLALLLTVGGAGAAAYGWLSTRATRWGNSLIVGPRFTGTVVLDGSGTRLRVTRDASGRALEVPTWNGQTGITLTFIGGFAVYHAPPAARPSGKLRLMIHGA